MIMIHQFAPFNSEEFSFVNKMLKVSLLGKICQNVYTKF